MIIKKNKINEDIIYLSGPYQRLFLLIKDVESIDVKEWTIMHSLAYICKKYNEKFNSEYIFSYQDSPSRSYEYKLCNRLWSMLGAKACEGYKVKEYIDWFYENYNSKSQKFRSIGALAKAELVSKFLSFKEKSKIPEMYSDLPEEIKIIINDFNELQYIKTFGDLLFLKISFDENPENLPKCTIDLFQKLNSKEFDLSVLDRLK